MQPTNPTPVSTSLAAQGMSGAVAVIMLYIMKLYHLPPMDDTTVAAFVVVIGGLMHYAVSLGILPQARTQPPTPSSLSTPSTPPAAATPPGSASGSVPLAPL